MDKLIGNNLWSYSLIKSLQNLMVINRGIIVIIRGEITKYVDRIN